MIKRLLLGLVFALPMFAAMAVATQGQATTPNVTIQPIHASHQKNIIIWPFETTSCASQHTVPTASELQMVVLTNQLRASKGIAPLSISPSLERSADTHSVQMATTGTFAHDSYGNTLVRTQSCGSPTQSIDENIAGNGSGDATGTFNQYVNSPEHLANLLDANMVSVGISTEEGIYNDGATVWHNFFLNTMTFASTADSNAYYPGSTPTPSPSPSPTPSPTPSPSPHGTLTAVLNAPTTALVGQAVSMTVTGSGATTPFYAIIFGDGVQTSWQSGTQFSHTYTTAGSYSIAGYIGDGATQQVVAAPQRTIAVTVSAPSPSPTPTPGPGSCTVSINGRAPSIVAC